MLNIRDGIFSAGRIGDSPFVGFHLGGHNENDGMKFSRKVMVMNVVTIPADGETIVVGGKTYTFKNTVTASTHVKIGNLITNGNFANADDGSFYGKHWTIDATGALHVDGPSTSSITAFSDYRNVIGGAVLVTSAAHKIATGDEVVITATTNYNGTYQIVKIDADTFYIFPQNGWKGDDATGTWTTTSYAQPLVQEMFPTPIVAKTYTVGYTVAGRSQGSVTAYIGGVAGATNNTDNTFSDTIVATSTDTLKFVPTYDFDGKISAVTVTEPSTDLKGLTATAIANRINLDTATSLCTAYVGLDKVGVSTEILVVANSIGITPTFTADGVKVVAAIAFTLTITEGQLETVSYFKKDITAESDVKPTVLVERNSGKDTNYLY